MTRNSRKKQNLSIKKFPSRKKQIGGSYYGPPSPSPTEYGSMAVTGRIKTASGISLESMKAKREFSNYVQSSTNLQNMIKDSTCDGAFFRDFTNKILELDKIRNNYIGALMEDNPSIVNVRKTAVRDKQLLQTKISKIQDMISTNKENNTGGHTVENMVRLNKIRKKILTDYSFIMRSEITILLDLIASLN